jgi:hypothetical protein
VADPPARCQTGSLSDASSSDRNTSAGQLRPWKEVRVYCVVKWGQQRLATPSQGKEPTGLNDWTPRHVTSCEGSQRPNALFVKTLRNLLRRRLNHRSCLNTVVTRKQMDEHKNFQNNAPNKTLEKTGQTCP